MSGLGINLFQVLTENPNQSATESLIKADEKGQILGPIGSNLQAGLHDLMERELGIMERKRAFAPDSAFRVPSSLQGKEFTPKFTSPLDRARRANEVLGIQRTLEVVGMALQIAEANPEKAMGIVNRLDFAEILRVVREVTGAPASMLLGDNDFNQINDRQMQQMQMQQAMSVAQQGAEVANNAMPAAGQGMEILQSLSEKIPQLMQLTQGAPNGITQ